MLEVLYVPQPGFQAEADKVVRGLSDEFVFHRTPDIEDAVNLLSLQRRNQAYAYDAVIIGCYGERLISTVARMRATMPNLPLIVLSNVKPLSMHRTRLLEAGADDCLPVRHVSTEEMRATILRRTLARHCRESSIIAIGNMTFDIAERIIRCDDKPVMLPRFVHSVLLALALRHPAIMQADSFLAIGNGASNDADLDIEQIILSRVRQTRRALREMDASVRLVNAATTGYQLEAN